MTTSCRFDFKKAVAESFRDHPHIRRNTAFLSTEENSFDEDSSLVRLRGSWRLQLGVFFSSWGLDVRKALKLAKFERSSYAVQIKNEGLFFNVYNPNDKSLRRVPAEERPIAQAYTFYHEQGHILCPDGFEMSKTYSIRESCADAYAALRLLQIYGDAARGVIAREAWYRAASFIEHRDAVYLTTPVLAKILHDVDSAQLAALSPAETVALAQRYAQDYHPAPLVIDQLKDFYASVLSLWCDTNRRLNLLATTCLAQSDAAPFVVAAPVLAPFVYAQAGRVNGLDVCLPEAVRDAVRQAMQRHGFDGQARQLLADIQGAQSASRGTVIPQLAL